MANGRGGRSRSHKVTLFSPDSRAKVEMTGSISEMLRDLAEDIKTKALRSAAHAGALVFYDEMKLRTSSPGMDGPGVKSGTLHDSIYRKHVDEESNDTRQVYNIGPNKRKAGHWFNVEYGHFVTNRLIPVDDARNLSKYGGAVVYGHYGQAYIATKQKLDTPQWVPAYPYARPTWEAKAAEAVEAMKARLAQRIEELKAGEQ